MNERIRECWLKAAREDSDDKWHTQEEFIERFIERFAELIVRECADVTHRLIVEDGKEFPVKSVAYRLKEHFGVKE